MSNGLLTPEQRRQAMSMGLLNAGVGLLSGAYNPGGRFGPAAAQGLAGFGGAMQQAQAAAIQQRQLEQEERFRTAQMQDLLIKRQMEQQKIIEEQQRRQTLQRTLERILGGQQPQAGQTPQGVSSPTQMPQSGLAGAALATQVDPSRTPQVDVVERPRVDPEALTMAGLTMAAQDPQTANVLLSGASNIRTTQEKEQARLRQQKLDDLADWKPVTGVPGIEQKVSEGKFYWNRMTEVPAKEVFELASKKTEAGAPRQTVSVFEKKGDEKRAERADEMQNRALRAARFSNAVGLMADALEGYGGGWTAEVQAKIGRLFPESEYGRIASVEDAARAVMQKSYQQVREEGTGQVSDFEAKGFMAAFPSLASTPRGRQYIKLFAQRMARREMIAADIYQDLADKGPVKLRMWSEAVEKEAGPYFSEEEWKEIRQIERFAPRQQQQRPAGTMRRIE